LDLNFFHLQNIYFSVQQIERNPALAASKVIGEGPELEGKVHERGLFEE
jgi:hypothetical protein